MENTGSKSRADAEQAPARIAASRLRDAMISDPVLRAHSEWILKWATRYPELSDVLRPPRDELVELFVSKKLKGAGIRVPLAAVQSLAEAVQALGAQGWRGRKRARDTRLRHRLKKLTRNWPRDIERILKKYPLPEPLELELKRVVSNFISSLKDAARRRRGRPSDETRRAIVSKLRRESELSEPTIAKALVVLQLSKTDKMTNAQRSVRRFARSSTNREKNVT
jgi:hypothetical protein